MLRVYALKNCDTCRKAVKWLRARGVAFEERAIRETPPTLAELREMLAAKNGELARLVNSAGGEYRALKQAGKLPAREEGMLALLATNGSLVKRPFAIGDGVALTGFEEGVWGEEFRARR